MGEGVNVVVGRGVNVGGTGMFVAVGNIGVGIGGMGEGVGDGDGIGVGVGASSVGRDVGVTVAEASGVAVGAVVDV